MTDLCKTPLHDQHLALGARMVDFGGWSMPLHYGSQLDEHHAVRTAAGMFDVSHMRAIDVEGLHSRAFLRHVLANDVDKLATPGRALYSCMLNPEGGVIDDLIVYFFEDDAYRLVVNAATAAKDLAWLDRVNVDGGVGVEVDGGSGVEVDGGSGVEVTGSAGVDPNGGFGVDLSPRGDLSIIAVQGPQARAKVWEAVGAAQPASEGLAPFHAARIAPTPFGELTIARTGYTGEDGFEIMVDNAHANALWSALAAAGVRPCGLAARDTLRLEAGMNLYGQDMDESVSPLDAGLGWTVDLRGTRDFIGKTALVAQGRRRAFVGLVLHGAGGVLRAHQKVVTAHGEGEITSGTFSPTLHGSIAFARVPDTVGVGDTVQVVIRDKQIEASVVKLPFVRHGRILSS